MKDRKYIINCADSSPCSLLFFLTWDMPKYSSIDFEAMFWSNCWCHMLYILYLISSVFWYSFILILIFIYLFIFVLLKTLKVTKKKFLPQSWRASRTILWANSNFSWKIMNSSSSLMELWWNLRMQLRD